MIPRNVAIVLNQKAAAAALTDKDKDEIQKKGAETFVKKEFGLRDKEATESAVAGLKDAAPEIAKAEEKDSQPATEHKHWWSK